MKKAGSWWLVARGNQLVARGTAFSPHQLPATSYQLFLPTRQADSTLELFSPRPPAIAACSACKRGKVKILNSAGLVTAGAVRTRQVDTISRPARV